MDDYVPSEFFLSQNYPNPFSDKTKIKFCIPFMTNVKLSVFNSDRELVIMLVDEEKEAGTYAVEFPTVGMRHASSTTITLPSEAYFYRLEAGNYSCEKKMLFLK